MKNLRQSKLFILLFAVISLIVVVNTALLIYQKHRQQVFGEMINIAGRERMLSQRMSKTAILLLNQNQNLINTNKDSLVSDLNEFKANMFVIKSNVSSEENKEKIASIQPFYRKLVDNIQLILYEKLETNQEQINEVLLNEIPFLVRMNKIVYQYVDDHNHTITFFRASALILTTLFLGLVLLKMVPVIIQNELFQLTLKEKNEQLEQTNATKDKFFAIIAHDLKGPMSVLNTILDYITSDFKNKSPEELEAYLVKLKLLNKSTYNLLENLLTWARSQRDEIIFSPVKTNLWQLTENTFNLYRNRAESKEINLINNIDDQLIVEADMEMINTIFRNLISNAIKFTRPGGKITVESVIENDRVRISVMDTGIGMEQSTQESLFQLESGHSSATGTAGESGTGLGLIICQEFVKKHKGKIWVESKINQGSVFYIDLPIKQLDTKKEETEFKTSLAVEKSA